MPYATEVGGSHFEPRDRKHRAFLHINHKHDLNLNTKFRQASVCQKCASSLFCIHVYQQQQQQDHHRDRIWNNGLAPATPSLDSSLQPTAKPPHSRRKLTVTNAKATGGWLSNLTTAESALSKRYYGWKDKYSTLRLSGDTYSRGDGAVPATVFIVSSVNILNRWLMYRLFYFFIRYCIVETGFDSKSTKQFYTCHWSAFIVKGFMFPNTCATYVTIVCY